MSIASLSTSALIHPELRGLVRTASVGAAAGAAIGAAAGSALRVGVPGMAALAVAGSAVGGVAAAATPIRVIRAGAQIENRPRPSAVRFTGAAENAQEGAELRIMSVNVRSLLGKYGYIAERDVLRKMAATITRLDPDVVVVQEVDSRTIRSFGVDQIQQLAARTGASDAQFVPALRRLGGRYGQGVILRNGVRFSGELQSHVLPGLEGRDESRIAFDVPVTTPQGAQVHVIGTHLTTDSASRPAQLDALARITGEAASRSGLPLVLAGDFNDTPARVHPRLRPTGLVDALAAVGIPPDAPQRGTSSSGRPIDYIYVSGNIAVRQAWVSGLGVPGIVEPATDHRAVVADIMLSPPAQVE